MSLYCAGSSRFRPLAVISCNFDRPCRKLYQCSPRLQHVNHSRCKVLRHNHWQRARHLSHCRLFCRASTGDEKPSREERDRWAVFAAGTALAVALTLALTIGREPIEDAVYGDGLEVSGSSLSAGDAAGMLLWGVALYFISPLQLLLLFLGRIETERPSDWALRQLGRAAGLRVDDVSYTAPAWLRAAVIALSASSGAAVALLLSRGLGDATWSVSTGLGACMAAGVYEVGRPQRLSGKEAEELEGQWQDFASFASQRLQRSGRCHESEISAAFKRQYAKYRSPDVFDDQRLRDMVRNWHRGASRSSAGFYKGISLQQTTDAFTGQVIGAAPESRLRGADVTAELQDIE